MCWQLRFAENSSGIKARKSTIGNKPRLNQLRVKKEEANALKKQYGSKDERGQIRSRVSIDESPAIAAEKTRAGD